MPLIKSGLEMEWDYSQRKKIRENEIRKAIEKESKLQEAKGSKQ